MEHKGCPRSWIDTNKYSENFEICRERGKGAKIQIFHRYALLTMVQVKFRSKIETKFLFLHNFITKAKFKFSPAAHVTLSKFAT